VAIVASADALSAQRARNVPDAGELHVMPLRGNVYLLVGAGANITLSVGREGVLLVDSGTAPMAEKVVAAVAQLARLVSAAPAAVKPCAGLGCSGNEFASILGTIASPAPPKPIQYIVNTNADPDHVGGNATVAAAGTTFGGGPGLGAFVGVVKSSATIYAHENVLQRMSAASIPTAALPTEGYPTDFKQFFNGEGIHLIHQPGAHTDGDTIVHFRGSDVISAGDVLSTVSYPVFDIARGGSINGIIDGLNALLDLAIAEYQTEGGTLVIPGHGRVCDSADVATYRDMVTIVRDRIQEMVTRGMTLDQVKAARPTKDYDPRYGAAGSTKDQFVEAVYRSLSGRK
jgi:glyoxylase-like metal-dependent hydrolase (beta-lactamase superfamily II)